MNTIPIKTSEDFEVVCDDILTDFLNSFTHEQGLLRDITTDDLAFLEPSPNLVIYSEKGMKLYLRYCERLTLLGESKFPDDVITIRSTILQTF